MNTQKRTIPYLVILGLAVAGYFLISPTIQAGETSAGSSEEIRQLLAQVKTEAVALDRDCDQLAALSRNKQHSWDSHALKISSIKDHVNQAGSSLLIWMQPELGLRPGSMRRLIASTPY